MKSNLLIIVFCVLSLQAFAQVKTEKVPHGKIPPRILKTESKVHVIKIPNKETVLKKLEESILGKDIESDSFAFGKFVEFNLDFDEVKSICVDGNCFKEIEVESPGSNTLGFVFSDLELSKNAKFYIINDAEEFVQGPLTLETINLKKNFISGLIPGERLRLLLVEPKNEENSSIVKIKQASHGIYDFFKVNKHVSSRMKAGPCFGCSASCNVNIACITALNLESKAVALVLIKSGNNYMVRGTGALINNGKNDLRPLFFTAAHIYNEYEWNDNSQFMFHFRSLQCSPTTYGSTTYYVQGSYNTLPGQGPTDLKLIELKVNPGISPVFSGNPVSYLGWSIIDEITPVQGIHHPLGDVQKHYSGTNVHIFNETIGFGNYYYWRFDLASGMHQPVSSGSPILNHSKRLISALRGKVSNTPPFSCAGPNEGAIGGRLSWSWPAFCQYLDPNNEGIVAINTITNTSGTAPKVFPNAHGPDLICTSGNFILLNAPLDLPINWEIVQGANLLTGPSSGIGKSVTLTRSGSSSGQAKIRFTVQNLCSSNKIYEKTFWVGQPNSPGGISGSTYTYQYSNEVYSVNPVSGASTYNWQIPNDWSGGSNSNAINVTVGSNSGYVSVTPQNSCGSGWTSSIYVTVNSCQFCRTVDIWPNPADKFVSVITGYKGREEDAPKMDLEAYAIYDVQGKLLVNIERKAKINPHAIEVSGLPKGLYFMHLIFEDETIIKRIIIDR